MKYMTFRLPTVFAVYAYEVDSLSTSYADNAKTVGNLKVMYFIEGAVSQISLYLCHCLLLNTAKARQY